MKKLAFCTCTDMACPLNPENHEQGCDLCVAKCLKKDEIPSCFFHKVFANTELLQPTDASVKDYTFHGFAEYVTKRYGK